MIQANQNDIDQLIRMERDLISKLADNYIDGNEIHDEIKKMWIVLRNFAEEFSDVEVSEEPYTY